MKLSPPGSSSKPTILHSAERVSTAQTAAMEVRSDSLHLGGPVHESDHAGQGFNGQFRDQEWHVGDVGSQEERVEMLASKRLHEARMEEFLSSHPCAPNGRKGVLPRGDYP